jgi:hypothetical protein
MLIGGCFKGNGLQLFFGEEKLEDTEEEFILGVCSKP